MVIIFEGVVRNKAVVIPPEVDLPEGTIVRIEAASLRRFSDLVELVGTWEGDDADRVVSEIYARRSIAPPRASLGS